MRRFIASLPTYDRQAASGGPYRSRRRRRQNLLVLRPIFRLTRFRFDDQKVVVHFLLDEGLAELGQELAFLQVAGENLELLDIVGRGLAHEVAGGAFLLGFGQTALD